VQNLSDEGVNPDRVFQVGDVMHDLAREMRGVSARRSSVVKELDLPLGGYIVATVHRAENTDDLGRLEAIIHGLSAVATTIPVVVPLHPRTRSKLSVLDGDITGRITIIDPLGYIDMTALVIGAALVVTDSGGVQKEAFFHGVPCVTLREETEWTELIESGWNELLSPDSDVSVYTGIMNAMARQKPTMPSVLPYGEGDAARRIVRMLIERLGA
jgi:UDP-GlcNAc3NAcA epimerase